MRARWIGVAIAVGVVLAAGCRRDRNTGASAEGAVVVAVQSALKSLDPHEAADAPSMRMLENLYCTLVRYGDGLGDIAPDLATSWEASEDGRTWTFHLADARFHSGRKVTSADVAWSVARIREKGVRAQHFDKVSRVETPDPRTVVFHLSEPSAPFLTHLAHPMNAVMDRQRLEASGGRLDEQDAGCGPFELVEWRRNQHLLARAFADHHAGAPNIERLAFRPISDETARTTALRTGEVHLVLDVPRRDLDELGADDDVVVRSVPGTFWEYVGLNTRRPPLDDPRVRRAIAWAVDREQMNALVRFGRATVLTGGHLPSGHWAHADVELFPRRDLERARQLLAEAGYPEGFEATVKVGSAFPYQVRAAEVLKQQLREVGIRLELRSMESGVFFDALGRGDFDMTVVGWVGFVDPDEWTYSLFHSTGEWNQQGYGRPEVDLLLEKGRRLIDREARAPVYVEAQRLIARDAPMVFLYVNEQVSAWRQGLEGFEVHPTATTRSLATATWKGEGG